MDDVELKLTSMMIKNPRMSLLKLSRELGLNYISLRERFRKLQRNGLIDFRLAVSPALLGDVAGVVRVRCSEVDKIVGKALTCNRVISAVTLNGSEALLILYGRSKDEIATLVSVLTSELAEKVEVNIEYGKIPFGEKISLKNPEPGCSGVLKCSNCIPVLRNRGKNNHQH
ncbi:Lrp/AsnC family transcriptional regulator [Thermosphaera chiliense]|uniref:Lrp/AsnC family transcriptional regulator n=1 Tax=Thermosphaera chiliense TaxID=3402707 RepID=A0A7M1UQX2_9CREN|nr:Lrp/AsnC family transcriptional regulator [Thermosphaera aggregans]QOR93843.1 Lrp/AsnC family transcriptional regulator [Thermosphaera aggregans]